MAFPLRNLKERALAPTVNAGRRPGRETGWLVGIGAALGLVGVVGMRQAISAIAVEAGAADPATPAMSLALLAGTALVAGLAPTRRAVHVDPLEALRTDNS
jgi:ABC-type antimicrobial peptide transport system permease subunit